MTYKSYLENNATEAIAYVTEILEGEKNIIRLDQTIFHPQGGGQKSDRGLIGNHLVEQVVHNQGSIDHYVEESHNIKIGQEYNIQIDVDWRNLNSLYHTVGHLIAAICEDMYPELEAIQGHQWPNEARVDFKGEFTIPDDMHTQLSEQLAIAIQNELPVNILGHPQSDRSVQIGNYPALPCGGTHITNLSEITAIKLGKITRKKGKLRLRYTVS